MKIAIFGATGKTGKEIVQQALENGHAVVAFVRDPSKMVSQSENVKMVQGDVFDLPAVEKAVEGVDVVLVALGASPDTKGAVNTDGTKNAIVAMKKHNVKRLIVESSFPMSGAPESMEYLSKVMPEEQVISMQPFIDDKAGQEKVTRESGLDWTIVRPSALTDEPKTGKYRVGENLKVNPGDNISRSDVADFMLKCVDSSEWVGKTVIITS
jgi:putative NADH-flavin reductase